MENSILKSTKKIIGIDPSDTTFDLDIITHINSAFSTLAQLGIGPAVGFAIEDDTAVWSDLIGTDLTRNSVRTYVYLKVRLIFDPPATSYTQAALEKQIEELEWRISVNRENVEWVDPDPTPPPEEDIFA